MNCEMKALTGGRGELGKRGEPLHIRRCVLLRTYSIKNALF